MSELEIKENVLNKASEVEKDLKNIFEDIDLNCFNSSKKVLKAFQDNKVATTDFNEITGYGYSDMGREKLEKVYSQIFRGRGCAC